MSTIGKNSSSDKSHSVSRPTEAAAPQKSQAPAAAEKPKSVAPQAQASGVKQDSYKNAQPLKSLPFQDSGPASHAKPTESIFANAQNRLLPFLLPSGSSAKGGAPAAPSVKLGAGGLTVSNTTQTGDASKTTSSTQVGPKGITVSNSTQAGDDKSSSSVTVGPGGVAASASNTTDGVTTGGSIKVSPDGVSATVNGALQVSKDIKVGFEASVSVSKTQTAQSKDGFTTATVEGNVSTKVGASAEVGVVGASGSVEVGSKTSFQVRMSDADYAAVQSGKAPAPSPYDPSTMPVGSSIQMKSTDFKGTEFEGTYRNIKLQTSVKESDSASILVEKTGQNTVRVTTGPSQAVENSFTIGVGIGPANVSIGKDRSLETSQMKTAEFDLSTPAGKEAYNKFMATGTMPTTNTPGVANVASIQKLSYNDTLRLGLELGPLKTGLTGEYSSDTTMTTFADGSKRLDREVAYGTKYNIQMHQTFGPDGKLDPSKDQYSLTYRPDASEAPNALKVVQAFTGDEAKAAQVAADVASGKPVSIVINMTRDQMQSNLQQLADKRIHDDAINNNGQGVALVRLGDPLMTLADISKATPDQRQAELTQIGIDLVTAPDEASRQAALNRLKGTLVAPEVALETIIRNERGPVGMAEDLLILREFQRPVQGSVDIKVG